MATSASKHFWIMGPTASGKSTLALEYAKKIESEIISVDSALIYKGLNIGTAKPTNEQLQEVKHHLVNICDIWQIYDVAQFCSDAKKIATNVHSNNKTVLMSGGTFLYFRSLENGLSILPKSDKQIQQKWQDIADKNGSEFLHNKLKDIDLISANKFHPNDSQRIIRALVVYEQTGKTITDLMKKQLKKTLENENLPKPIKVALLPNTENLKEKIRQRFMQMLKDGLIDEVQNLINLMKNKKIAENDFLNYPALKSIGYKEVLLHLTKKLSYEEMIEKAIIATNQLAKRQRTWLRSEKNTVIFNNQNLALEYMLENSK